MKQSIEIKSCLSPDLIGRSSFYLWRAIRIIFKSFLRSLDVLFLLYQDKRKSKIQLEIDVKSDSTKTYSTLNDSEKGMLDAVADSDTRAAIKAQLILRTYFGDEYEKYFPLLEEGTAKKSISKRYNDKIKIFPNPANQTVHLKYAQNSYKNLKLFNAMGKLIFRTKVSPSGFDVLNIQQLVSGVYYIKLQGDDGEEASEKLLIVK